MSIGRTIDRELLRRLPKAELHCHLDGSLRAQTLLELAHEYGQPMPRQDAESLAAYMLVSDGHSLEDYLQRFSVTLSVMQTAAALERIAYELGVDAAADGVRYLEVRYAPILNVRHGLSLGDAVTASLRGLRRAEQELGIIARVIICGIRSMAPAVSLELAELAVAFRHEGVVGFDLAGGEAGHPASAHQEAFTHAHRHDLACTCHAGEGDGPESVRQALHTCCADRIGHGTRIIEDPALLDYVNDRRVPVEVCLTSNIQTRAAGSYDTHPLRQYFDRGVNVVLNTDNRLMSGTTLTDEYAHAVRHLDFSFDELARMALNGFESAFLPYEQRQMLIADAERDLVRLRKEIR
ncbi:MAG: adenosine deaminase [Gemmatimonadaceae bacterium]